MVSDRVSSFTDQKTDIKLFLQAPTNSKIQLDWIG